MLCLQALKILTPTSSCCVKKIISLACLLIQRIGSKTTDECGDEWRRVHTTGDEYIRVGIVQETSTYECLEVRRRVHMTGDEYI